MTTLDIRWPLGLIFTLIGAILLGYGAWAELPVAGADEINAGWGGVLLLFGAAMLWLARRGARRLDAHG